MIYKNQISKKLANLPIESLSKTTGFIKRKNHCIKAGDFILSFFVMLSKGNNSLVDWAKELSILTTQILTKGAIHSKLQPAKEAFFEQLLSMAISKSMETPSSDAIKNNLLTSFKRVFVEDSMCCSLPRNLFESFRGAHSTTNKDVATARIQFRTELKSNTVSNISIQSYRDNDQKFSGDILSQLSKDDLVLRDMGYYVLRNFRTIIEKKAFFLSRLPFQTYVYQADGAEQIDLYRILKNAAKKGRTVFDKQVVIGKKEQLSVRLVAIRVPQNVYQTRRRKAVKRMNNHRNYSEGYLDSLEWTIFITNVSEQVWTPLQMLKVYGFRWRIEIIFKCWKSHFNFERMFTQKNTMTLPRATITIYLLLIWITLIFMQFYNFFFDKVLTIKNEFISILKFAKFFKEHFETLISNPDNLFILDLVTQFCVYKKVKDKSNFCQEFYM
jgi:hypothetical protein